MWQTLADNPINDGLEDKFGAFNDGETWQYMGSTYDGKQVLHSFRHRCHPKDNIRRDVTIHGSPLFDESQIDFRRKLK